eukprot:GHVR01083741.1.p1 GENE.GHVR01083741.1~~GHVR01083741.1.p1  ORF type:complete len:395 (+),score=75.72 GHVR01083741.1:70-1185(+)
MVRITKPNFLRRCGDTPVSTEEPIKKIYVTPTLKKQYSLRRSTSSPKDISFEEGEVSTSFTDGYNSTAQSEYQRDFECDSQSDYPTHPSTLSSDIIPSSSSSSTSPSISPLEETPKNELIETPKPFVVPDASRMSELEYFHADKIVGSQSVMSVVESLAGVTGDSLCLSLVNRAIEPVGWKDTGVKHGIKCERRRECGTVRGTVQLNLKNLNLNDVLEYIWKGSMPHSINPAAEGATRLVTVDNGSKGSCIYHVHYHGQFGFPGRDFVLGCTNRQVNNNTYAVASTSIAHNELDTLPFYPKGRVRANVELGGYVVRMDENGVVYLHAVWNLDLKIANIAPSFVVNKVLGGSILHLENLKKLIENMDKNIKK